MRAVGVVLVMLATVACKDNTSFGGSAQTPVPTATAAPAGPANYGQSAPPTSNQFAPAPDSVPTTAMPPLPPDATCAAGYPTNCDTCLANLRANADTPTGQPFLMQDSSSCGADACELMANVAPPPPVNSGLPTGFSAPCSCSCRSRFGSSAPSGAP